MKTSCCFDCKERTQFCHITCSDYVEEQERVRKNKVRNKKQECSDFFEIKKQRIEKSMKKRRRNKCTYYQD